MASPNRSPLRLHPLASSLLALGLAALLPEAQAITTTWIAPDGGSWEAAANWSAGVPGAADLVILAPATRPASSVVVASAATVGGLTLARVNLLVRDSIVVNGAMSWDEQPALQAGVLGFSGSLAVPQPTLRVLGTAQLTGGGARGINNTGVLDFAGATTWSGNTAVDGNAITIGITSANTVLRNRGVFTDANTVDTALLGRGTFDNPGNFVKSGPSVTRVDVSRFDNSGSVAVAGGTLRFPSLASVQTGNWDVAAGATLEFSGGTPTLQGTLSGAGQLRLSGGTVAIEGFGKSVPVVLDGATLSGSYQVFDGPFTWRSGAFGGAGTTLMTGRVSLEGDVAKLIGEGRQIVSYGPVAWSGAGWGIGQGTQGLQTNFTNLGTFTDAGDVAHTVRGVTTDLSTFVNGGSYVKNGSSISTFATLSFQNTGLLDVRGGLVRFLGPMSNSGVIRIAAGAGLLATGSPLDNTGTITGDGSMDVTRGFVNRGLISPGDAIGTLTLGSVNFGPEGRLKIELGAGTHDLLRLTGTAQFGGHLEVSNTGYTPVAGDLFTILEYAAWDGATSFADVVLDGFAAGVHLDLVYGSTALQLRVIGDPANLPAVPEPGTWALWLAGLGAMGGWRWRRAAGAPAAAG